jgi:hypothetical protein
VSHGTQHESGFLTEVPWILRAALNYISWLSENYSRNASLFCNSKAIDLIYHINR